MAARRIQDWTNKNIFFNSFDYPESSYQQNTIKTQNNPSLIQEELLELTELNEKIDSVEDPHSIGGKSITALQAAWNVTNAIQGMFIVGLPFAVKVI